MATTKSIDQPVLDILATAVCDGSTLTIPGALDRAMYVQVDKVLKAAGGRWDRKAGGHVFAKPAAEVLAGLTGTGTVHDERQELGVFYTPAPVVEAVADTAGIEPGDWVLEPSLGSGRLAAMAIKAGAHVHGFEVRTGVDLDGGLSGTRLATGAYAQVDKVAVLSHGVPGVSHPEFDVKGATPALTFSDGVDFLTVEPRPIFDRIVMNPPFAKQADIAHVAHALSFLKPGGRLVAITTPSWQTSATEKAKAFRALLDAQDIATVSELPDGSFKESGTGVSTVLLVVDVPA
jgi:type I restriction-modification system DNA methylase subunit